MLDFFRASRRFAGFQFELLLVGCLSAALLFSFGCQGRSSARSDQDAVECVQAGVEQEADSGEPSLPGRAHSGESSELPGPMVRLTADELAQSTSPYLTMVSMGRGGLGRVAGESKWGTVGRDLHELPGVMWEDTKAIARNPSNWLILGAAGAGSIAGEFTFDNHVDEQLRGREIINEDWTIAVGAAGNPATHFGLAAAIYTHGLISDNPDTYDFGKTLTQALALNGLATVLLKAAAWNDAPNGEFWAWPSGHTSSTMTVASVVHEYYGLLPAAPLYALTGLVMYERMITGEHWASDVIFGAALGFVIGHSVAGDQPIQLFGMDVVPYTDPYNGSTGVGLVKAW